MVRRNRALTKNCYQYYIFRKWEGKMKNQSIKSYDYIARFMTLCQWVAVKQKGKNIDSWLKKNNIRKIAIYGMGQEGELLIKELNETEIEIVFGIDRKPNRITCEDIHIVAVEDINKMPSVDAIVVSFVSAFYEMREELQKQTNARIVSLHDVLYEV